MVEKKIKNRDFQDEPVTICDQLSQIVISYIGFMIIMSNFAGKI